MINRIDMGRVCAGLLLGGAMLVQGQTYSNAFSPLTFSRPLWMEEIPSKPGYLMVMEQGGTAQVVTKQGGAWTKTQFVKVTVTGGTSAGNEQGLLGFAFHPQFATNRKYYVYYVGGNNGDRNIVDERLADETLLKDAGTAPRTILSIVDFAGNHNGGTIRFGSDGFLYLGTGDGGDQNDPNGNGQNKNALLAKMLRIDVNKQENGKQYGIPSDNPYAAGGGSPEIYAYGFRNPYKWAFDPVTKEMWVGDVGQGYAEEVNIVVKGGNYGWKVQEGDRGTGAGITNPVAWYNHGQGNAIVGGYVFRGNPASKYNGYYLYGDNGAPYNVWAAKSNGADKPATVATLAKAPSDVRGWGTDNAGRLYMMAGTSIIYAVGGTDFEVATANFIPQQGALKQAIGCIFHCRPGSRLDAAAFGSGSELGIFTLSGESMGKVSQADGAIPAGLKMGMYILKSSGSAKPNLLMLK